MAASRVTIDELVSGGEYMLLAEMTHEELTRFLVEYFIRRRSWVVWLHHAMTAATAGAIAFVAVDRGVSFLRCAASFALAFLTLFIVILPLHEAIHAIAYRLVGARDIRWGYSWRMLAAWVTAHRFVCERAPFVFVALAPFVVLNAAIIAGAIVWPSATIFLLFLLLWHLQGASGDWSLLNFIWLHRARGFWTYDDAASGKSYFFGRAP